MFDTPRLSLERGPEWARSREAFQERLQSLDPNWYDSFAFDNGVMVSGRSPSYAKLSALQLPSSLEGLSVLDVGAYEGFYTFHMEQRGAFVTANDSFVWNFPGDPSRTHIDFLREALGSEAVLLDADIPQLPDRTWDIVLFLGVLYHLEDPIGALRQVRRVTGQVTILETLVDGLDLSGPFSMFYPASTLNGDPTNKFGPNLEALVGMVREAGFSRWEFKSLWHWNTNAALAGDTALLSPLRSGRVVLWLYP